MISQNVYAQSITIFVWEDMNGDGEQAGEVGISGISTADLQIFLDANSSGTLDGAEVALNYDSETAGEYLFDNAGAGLAPGQYVAIYNLGNLDNYYITMPAQGGDVTQDSDFDQITGTSIIDLTGGGDEVDVDLGLYLAAEISNFVWEDVNGDGSQAGEGGNGIAGITVSLLDDLGAPVTVDVTGPVGPITATTGGAGDYSFTNLVPGNYIVEFEIPTIGGFDWFATDYTVHDDATDNGDNSDAIPDIPNNPQTHVIELSSDEVNDMIDAGFYAGSKIGDFVFCDENGNGIDDDGVAGVGGVVARVLNSTDLSQAQDPEGNDLEVTSDPTGMYMFTNVPPGEYIIEFELGGGGVPDPPFAFTTLDAVGSNDDNDSDVNNDEADPKYGQTEVITVESQDTDEEMMWDAGVYQEIQIRGNLWFDDPVTMDAMYDPSESGVSAVEIILIDQNDPTNTFTEFTSNTGDGEYVFDGIPPGEYVIQIPGSEFMTGGNLIGFQSCDGFNDANNGVDDDDNGPDGDPDLGDIFETTPFTLLSNCDPTNPPTIRHIDFCFFANCGEENPIAATACDAVDPINTICDVPTLDNFCNLMPTADSGGNQPGQLCPDGGVPHNISWFAFVAYDGDYSVTVTPTGCFGSSTGVEGVQIGLYTDCSFDETVYCNPNCNLDPVTFESDGSGTGQTGPLVPGQTYYFFIDGCSSSVCSYDVVIDGNPIVATINPFDMCIVEDDGAGTITSFCSEPNVTLCPNADVTFQVQDDAGQPLDLTVDYTWTVNALSGGPGPITGETQTDDENLILNFANEGEYEVCVTRIENGCSSATWNGPICKMVTIVAVPDEEFDPQTICDLADFDPTTLDPQDPNADGTLGWQDPAPSFDFGTNEFMVDEDGCMYTQTFELMEFTPSPDGTFSIIVCNDELPLNTPGLPEITDASFVGSTMVMLDDLLLVGITDKNGCDSIVDYAVERLFILDGEISVNGPCIPTSGVPLIFDWQDAGDVSTDGSFFSYEWFDPAGNPITDDDAIGETIFASQTTGSGEYSLVVTIMKDGKTCTFPYTIDINFDDFLPPVPEFDNPVLALCGGDGPVTYTAINVGDAFEYAWVVDPASAVVNGGTIADDFVEVDWNNTSGGTVTLTTANGCGNAPSIDITVVATPPTTPMFTATDTVCVDGPATIVYTGDQSVVDAGGYAWNFSGGTVTNGADLTGPGPFEVTWPTGGTDQTVSVSVTHGGGCVSATETAMIHILTPQAPPAINCTPSLDEVVFMWDDVPGAVDYIVDVTTGPDGTLAGNTYTISGLAENQTVNITLTILTGDACVEIMVDAACTTQNCTPPIVSISSPLTDPICLDGTDQSFDLVQTIPTGVTGTADFTGNGIIDAVAGTFDPAVAGVGVHTINYLFTDSDGCFAPASTNIEVFGTPLASFTTDVDTVCITDPFTITYDGTVGTITEYVTSDGQTVTGSIDPTITFSQAGDQTITLVVSANGCPSEPFIKNVFVQDELDDLIITCITQEIDNVEFGWNAVDGATGYEIIITNPDGSVDPPFTTTNTSHPVTGLNPDDEVMISVRVLTNSRCPGDSETGSCTAQACPSTITVEITEIADICLAGSTIPIDLQATVSGDSDGSLGTLVWSGDGVTGSQFDPSTLSEGTATINVEYIENGCGGYTGTQDVEITLPPLASFDVPTDPICVGSSLTIMYTGSQLPNQSIDWSGSGVAVTPTGNTNEYTATFSAAGSFDLVLAVTNDGCPQSDALETIEVEAEIPFGAVDCDPSEDQIDFSWAALDCASEYEVFVGGVSQGLQSETTFSATGLGNEESATIQVVAISTCACGDITSEELTCETSACVDVNLSISAMGGMTDFCTSPDLSPIEILTLVEGETGDGAGSFSGTAVDQDGMFDPLAAGIGTHVITYTYIEPNGCMDFVDEITFNIFDNPMVEAIADPIDCYDIDMTTLTITPSNGDGNYAVTNGGIPIELVSDVPAGSYDIQVVDGNGCTDATSVVVTVPAEPMPAIDGSSELILGETSNYGIQQSIFSGLSIDSIVWTANGAEVCNDPACFALSNQAPTENTTYIATVFYNNGCSVTAMFDVEVREEDPIYTVDIPNIMSPNADGQNDVWQVFTGDPNVEVSSAKILDRWGNLVFQAPAGSYAPATTVVTWDGKFEGKDLLPGVYVYIVEYTQDERARTRTGDITIIR